MDEPKVPFENMALEYIIENLEPYLHEGEVLEIVKLKYRQLYRSHHDLNQANLSLKKLSTKLFLEQEEIKASSALKIETLKTVCRDLTMKIKMLKKQNEETLTEAKERFDKLGTDFNAIATKLANLAPKVVQREEQRELYDVLDAERESWKYERELLQENMYHSQTVCIRLQKDIHELEYRSKKHRDCYKYFEYAVRKSKQLFDVMSKMLQMKNYIRSSKTDNTLNKECLEKSIDEILNMIKSDYEEKPESCTQASETTGDMKTENMINRHQEILDQLFSDIQATKQLLTTAASVSSNKNVGKPTPAPRTSPAEKTSIAP